MGWWILKDNMTFISMKVLQIHIITKKNKNIEINVRFIDHKDELLITLLPILSCQMRIYPDKKNPRHEHKDF